MAGEPSPSAAKRAVFAFSGWNRRRKAEAINSWLAHRSCNDLLMVGMTGTESTSSYEGLVERAIAKGRTVRAGINLYACRTDKPFVIADARQLPFSDKTFDLGLANAIIEHVGAEVEQQAFVDELARACRCLVITTPNRWFPIEAHTATVLLHWLPSWRRQRTEFTRLLSRRELRELLPDGAVLVGRPWSPTFIALYEADS